MVRANDVEQFIAEITTTPLFSNLGAFVDSSLLATDARIIRVSRIEEAIRLWQISDLEEAQSVAWEACRQAIMRDGKSVPKWEDGFRRCQTAVSSALHGSPGARKLVRKIDEDFENFARRLPFLGAVGELLIQPFQPEWTFNLGQVPFYSAGLWVCGWHGTLSEDRFVYPEGVFYIY